MAQVTGLGSATAEAVVRGHGLAQRYGKLRVFSDLDFAVSPGVTALLGPNGAGKTTLLHTIVGLKRPYAGELQVMGVNVLRRGGLRAVAARLGFLPQSVGYYPGYTLGEFVTYTAWLKRVPRERFDEYVADAIARADLTGKTAAKMSSLSGGMLRRAGIAQAIVHRPELIILDEPAAGLDPEQRIEFRGLLRDLASTATVLVSTHVVEDVRHVADRVVVLSQGSVAFTGSVGQLEAAATPDAAGDSQLERGYVAALRRKAGIGA